MAAGNRGRHGPYSLSGLHSSLRASRRFTLGIWKLDRSWSRSQGRHSRRARTAASISRRSREHVLVFFSDSHAPGTMVYLHYRVRHQSRECRAKGRRIIGKVRTQPRSPSQQLRVHRHSRLSPHFILSDRRSPTDFGDLWCGGCRGENEGTVAPPCYSP